MRKVVIICLAVFLFLLGLVYAAPDDNKCTVRGNDDFTISFDVDGPGVGQYLVLEQGQGGGGYVAWYTDENRVPSEYQTLIRGYLETELESEERYHIVIAHDQTNKRLLYYRKPSSAVEDSWDFVKADVNVDLKEGLFKVYGAGLFNNQCADEFLPPVAEYNYTLMLSPESDMALICEDITPTVSVMNNGQIASEFTGTVVVSIDGVEQGYSGESHQLVVQSGGVSKTVSVTAYIEGDQENTLVSGTYEFVPYKFAADDQYVIANKAQRIEINALACDDNGGVVDASYSGSPTILHSWQMPSSGASGSLTFAPEFASGTANSNLVLDDAGAIAVSLEEASFDCSGLTGCPMEGRSTLKGNFMLYSRPWKFAVCALDSDGKDTDAGGTSEGGGAYKAAGDVFSVRVAPLKYSSSECDDVEQLTQNYFLSDASVELTHQLQTPKDGIKGNLTGRLTRQVTLSDKKSNGYIFSELTYDEVGSITLSAAETGAFYSTMDVDGEAGVNGESNIGRFYPDYFKVTGTEWIYPENQNYSIYMGQDFSSVMFEVTAYNANGNVTQNYGNFAAHLKADFYLAGEYSDRLTILNSELASQNWTGGIWRKTWDRENAVHWRKDLTLPTPDGPFNVTVAAESGRSVDTFISLSLNNDASEQSLHVDPSLFLDEVENDPEKSVRNVSQSLLSQPDVRFGRIRLEDVGGHQGATLAVPLRVEYWNGDRFVENTDDNGTTADSELEKQNLIWFSEGGDCTILLNGYATVSGGTTRKLLAEQDSTTCHSVGRQQTEIWLDLDSGGNHLPWLKYNWDSSHPGEENPSSVVTFGIYRGNDRVIYRGEPGLTTP